MKDLALQKVLRITTVAKKMIIRILLIVHEMKKESSLWSCAGKYDFSNLNHIPDPPERLIRINLVSKSEFRSTFYYKARTTETQKHQR